MKTVKNLVNHIESILHDINVEKKYVTERNSPTKDIELAHLLGGGQELIELLLWIKEHMDEES